MTVASSTAIWHISFYKFVRLLDAAGVTTKVNKLATTYQLEGTIDVACEGISGAVSGLEKALNAFEAALTGEPLFANAFASMLFKRTACRSKPFHMLKVSHTPELIRIGLDAKIHQAVNATTSHGVSLSPEQWRELLTAKDVVVIDNRNSFEFALGHFQGAIDPQVAHYRDFPKFIEANMPVWKAQGKRVAMYCTGGIRCEKTAAWMDSLDTTVYMLEGGILNYLAKTLDLPVQRTDWFGECFVFDNRIALNAKLEQTDTDIEDVYDEQRDGAWRIERAKRLAGR